MGLRSWWQDRQLTRARRYLAAQPDLALRALRQSPELAVAAVNTYWARQIELNAASGAGPDRKTAPWPILTQLGHGARHALTQTLPKATPYNLRRFSEYPPARRAINAITNPLVELAWQIRKIPDPKAAPSLEERLQIALATQCLTTPNDDDSWRTFAEAVLEDIVVGGYGAIEVGRTDDPARPLYLWPVDGQSIRINANWDPAFPDEPRYSQALAYVGLSVGTHDRVELRDDELIYLKLNPRTHTPFGLGYLEVAFSTINAWLGAVEYAERRASNAIPNVAIFLGEHVDLPTARQWRIYWQEQIEGYGQVPILGGGPKPEVMDLRGTGVDQLYLEYQEMLLRVIAMAFGVSQLSLGLERDVNRCHDEETEVLTLRGWKRHNDVSLTDYIATVHPQTGRLEYHHPIALHRYRYQGKMLRLRSALTDLCVTPNHRLWIGKVGWGGAYEAMQMVLAEDLPHCGRQFYEWKAVKPPARRWHQRAPRRVRIPSVPHNKRGNPPAAGFVVDRDVWLRFLGYYLSEGSLTTSRNTPGVYRCRLYQKAGPVADKIRQTLQAFPQRFHEHYYAPTQRFHWETQSKALYQYLRRTCGAGAAHKRIPHWIKTLPPAQLAILFEALMEGDGTWRHGQAHWTHGLYTTASKQLADDVQELAFKLGYRTQIAMHGQGLRPAHHRPLYRIMVSRRARAMSYTRNIAWEDYDGVVWCVEVPPNGLFVTRRHGKISIHGNSTAQTQDVQDWDSIKPVAGTVKDYLDRRLLWKTLGYTTLEFTWQMKDTDEARQAQILGAQWEMDAITVDELRAIYEREPLPNGLGQLTKTPFTAVIQQQTAPEMGALGGPPPLDGEGRWTDAHPSLPLSVEDVGESDDLEHLLQRARRVLEREEARQQAAWWHQAAAG
jgi:hypothetical protein